MSSDKIEWRYKRERRGLEAKVDYTSLIYRLSKSEQITSTTDSGVPGYKIVKRDMLIVVRLKGKDSCVIGKVPNNVSDMNVEARKIADNTEAACL